MSHGFIATLDLTDADKLAAGKYACEQVAAGSPDVVAVEGIDAATNQAIVLDAVTLLCPDQEPTFRAYLESQPL